MNCPLACCYTNHNLQIARGKKFELTWTRKYLPKLQLRTCLFQVQRNLRHNIAALISTEATSLSARSPTPTHGHEDTRMSGLEHSAAAKALQKENKQLCNVKSLDITV